MKNISLKLQESILEETEEILIQLKSSRNKYINQALDFYNRVQRRKILREKLKKESQLVAQNSLHVLNDFDELDYGED